ncbi:MAG: nuclear transport factor 2 family protein [Gammaproteobacteria bacterium]|nr:nuclear transport factor 2 family protein [Gammaproteobacteria bacterium]
MSLLATRFTFIASLTAGIAIPLSALAAQPLDDLARDVDRAESIRAVKQLQRTYAQYSQYGLWKEMADLFASNGRYVFDDTSATGPAAIATYLTEHEGYGHQGLHSGEVHTQLIGAPVVTLDEGGESAKGRWYGLFLLSDSDGNASIQGGIFENEYVREAGRWKIGVLHFHPQYAGSYETGWDNWQGKDLGFVPFHFTPDGSGIPIPAPTGTAPTTNATLEQLEERIAVMNDESLVRNLQAAYGYYVNRRMWDDVSDLFAADGVYEVSGIGVYQGPAGAGRGHQQRMGPAGLTDGVLNDRLQFDTTVSFAPGRREAHVRGIEFGMLGDSKKGESFWEVSVYDNRFVKEDGLWKVREMRVFPLFKADYHEGWGKSRLPQQAMVGEFTPDVPAPASDAARQNQLLPAFVSHHPVTGKPIAAPEGMQMVATQSLTEPKASPKAASRTGDTATRISEARRKLAMATAYDGAENVSSTYGMYADDFQWPGLAAIFGKTGTKQIPFAGYYTGADRIAHALNLEYGDPPTSRAGIAFHWRIQPVIVVAPDGRSARLRTYLFHPNTGRGSSTLFGAIYPDDHLILEDGIWRLWNLSLDEPYFTMDDWKGGWSAVKPLAERPPRKPRPVDPTRPKRYLGADLVAKYRPDVPISELGKLQEHFRGGTGEPWEWPQILPMWWGYKNPVSGREPELFLPDCVPCDYSPQMSMVKHGYLLPTTEPVRSED